MYYNVFSDIRQPKPLLLGGLLFSFLSGNLTAVGFACGVDQTSFSECNSAASGASECLLHGVSFVLFKYVL